MRSECPGCRLATHRGEDGYTLGALWFNLLAAEAFSTATWVMTLVVTWPNPPWDALRIIGPLEALIMPVVFYPFSKALFLAFDLAIRPPEPVAVSTPE